MRLSVRIFVAIVTACAIAVLYALWRHDPIVDERFVKAAICFMTLGLLAQTLRYQLARAASGSIAFIPFLAIGSLAPSWTSAVCVAVAASGAEVLAKRSPIKALFNVAQYTFATGLGILAYIGTGGKPLVDGTAPTLNSSASLVLLFCVFMTVNWTCVSSVIALSEKRNPWRVWADNTLSTVIYDLFSFPLLFLFVYVYAQFGPTGALVLSVLILGIRQLYKTNWQLETANQELLQLMVAAIEARDPYTSGHSKRVAHYSRVIARSLGLGHRAVERIGVAALLHDVGKIHEAFAPILSKPGQLTPDERILMETHPIKSAELVSNVSQLKDVMPAVRHHHENWDGTGYPDGLAGETIPLGARIIMFADTIDAMTTDRPYRKALGPDDVRKELQRCRGKQFDPHICDTLLGSTFFAQLFHRAPTLSAPLGVDRVAMSVKATA